MNFLLKDEFFIPKKGDLYGKNQTKSQIKPFRSYINIDRLKNCRKLKMQTQKWCQHRFNTEHKIKNHDHYICINRIVHIIWQAILGRHKIYFSIAIVFYTIDTLPYFSLPREPTR